jgi:hypothetical protein
MGIRGLFNSSLQWGSAQILNTPDGSPGIVQFRPTVGLSADLEYPEGGPGIVQFRTRLFEYYKRPRTEFSALRREFRSKVSVAFLKKISNDPESVLQLQRADLTEAQIEGMRRGEPPDGYQVHHKLSLDDTGSNDLDNLILVKEDPFHWALSGHQISWTNRLKAAAPGEASNASNTATILWPEFKRGVIVYNGK